VITDGKHLNGDSPLTCDVLIVGAGPAGIVLARELAKSGRKIVIVDGGRVCPPAHVGRQPGPAHDLSLVQAAKDIYRATGLGGATALWGGFCLPYDQSALQPRVRLGLPGWPLSLQEIRRYEDKAQEHLNLSTFAQVAEQSYGFRDQLYTDEAIELHQLQFSRADYVRIEGEKAFRQSGEIFFVENVYIDRIVFGENRSTVKRIEGVDLARRRVGFAPRFAILASGCIEATRLLLAQRSAHPTGIGNAGGHLGRHLMSHLEGLVPLDINPQSVLFGRKSIQSGSGPAPFVDVFKVDQKIVREENLLNCHAWLHRPILTDPAHASATYSLLFFGKWLRKRLIRQEHDRSDEHHIGRSLDVSDVLKHVANIALGAPELWRTLYLERRSESGHRRPFVTKGVYEGRVALKWNSEQEPNPKSFIQLNHACDALGNPLAEVRWEPSDLDRRTVRRHLEILEQSFRRRGIGGFTVPPEEAEHVAVGGHYIGTTRMASSESDGVVDPDCRVFSTDNLYVAASSVFPTSDSVNPTFMLVTLATRLADHLEKKLGQPLRIETQSHDTFARAAGSVQAAASLRG